MADGKNSIIVYRNWKKIFDELTDDEAGKLIKHFFSYVNDEKPILDDRFLNMAFLPIKDTLKRDLEHWESVKERRSESGRIGGLRSGLTRSKHNQNEANEPNASKTKQNEANEAVIDIVNVIVNDNVNDINKENNKKFIFKTSIIGLGVSEQIASDWLKVRKDKKASNTETAFNAIKREILQTGIDPNRCIQTAVERSWAGFKAEWMNNLIIENGQQIKQSTDPGDQNRINREYIMRKAEGLRGNS